MILLNFSHPLTPDHLTAIRALTDTTEIEVRTVAVQVSAQEALAPQVVALVAAAAVSSEQWQTVPILVNPPGYAPVAVALMAELHGRMGHFPAVLRLRPLAGSVPTRYEVAEILHLQGIREAARTRR